MLCSRQTCARSPGSQRASELLRAERLRARADLGRERREEPAELRAVREQLEPVQAVPHLEGLKVSRSNLGYPVSSMLAHEATERTC